MKKIIAGIAVLLAVLIGILAYQANEKSIQDQIYEEAAVFFQEQDYKKAIQYFEDAMEHENLFSGSLKEDIPFYQAEAYLKLEEFETAISLYNEILTDSPKESKAYVLKAFCQAESGKQEQAADTYQKGYETTKDEEFLYYLANLYVTMENYEEALDVIASAGKSDDSVLAKLKFLEIVIYEKQNDYKTAYEKAVAYCEEYPEDENGAKERDFLKSRQ